MVIIKGLLRIFSSSNAFPNRISFSVINSLRYQSRVYFRNIHASASIASEPGNHGMVDRVGGFREYIQKNNNFRSPILEIINLNFPLDNKHESLKLLVKLKEDLQNDCLWKEMFDCLSREIGTFDVEDLLKVIALFSDLRINTDSSFFQNFTASLDNELKIRSLKLDDVLEILFALKHTLLMGKSLKNFRFYWKLLRSLDKLHKFQPLQVTHIVYYLEEFNGATKSLYKYPLLKFLKDNLSQFKTEEMAIILAALVRAKLFSSDVQFIQNITDKLLNEIENVSSKHLFYACKFLSGSSKTYHSKVILDFQEKLIPHISKFNESSLISALLSGYPYFLNLSFWNNVVERLKIQIKTLFLVDFERIASITTAFEVNHEELLKLIIEEVEERQDLEKCSTHFVSLCKHLVMHRIYPKKLLDIILSNDYVDGMVSRSFFKEIGAWVFLNCTLQIDKPEYQCTCLNEALEKKIMKKFFANKAVKNLRLRYALLRHLKTIFGDSKVFEQFCLLHFDKGLIMRFDQNLNAMEIPEEFKIRSKKHTRAPLDQHLWLCMNVVFISQEGFSPAQETYMRHLTAFGYKPVLVSEEEFHHFRYLGTEELQKYLKDVIQRALEEILQEKQNKLTNKITDLNSKD